MNQNILSRVRRWYLINIQSVVEDLFRKVYKFWKDWQTLRRIRIIWAFYKLDENVKSLRKTETAWNPREPFSDPTGSFGLLFTLSFVTVLPIVHCISICLWIVCSCLWIVCSCFYYLEKAAVARTDAAAEERDHQERWPCPP